MYKSYLPTWIGLHRGDENLWPVRRVMMAFLAAERAVLPVKENALADVDLHVAVGGL